MICVDMVVQTAASADLGSVGISGSLATWLVGSQGLTASDAQTRFNSAPAEIRATNITRKKQYDLFMLAYIRLEDDVKRTSQKPSTLHAYHPNSEITPDQAWNEIPEKIKEILVDLRYRGDYTTHARLLFQRYAYTGDLNSFGQVLSDRNNWLNVPEDRFNKRIEFYEN